MEGPKKKGAPLAPPFSSIRAPCRAAPEGGEVRAEAKYGRERAIGSASVSRATDTKRDVRVRAAGA